ncbi:Protein kinase, ATP binding site-containing protein [Artemisia annua]|uniref:Protein kinase, ATP binding site-containing protein n=1 Tax=Artemisia annua TaxID=35608 RepID=A0A2U1KR41_ARTAN|nr:Protein kinase, ATP binding site-containing protein [Artemisia annua]
MIIVTEYAINGSLEDHLLDPEKLLSLTWPQRLKICIGAAKGLYYLHSVLGEGYSVIHGNFKSRNIWLDENLEAKLCSFYFSREVGVYQKNSLKVGMVNSLYIDPIYMESCFVRPEADAYSFGVVLFELLIGMLANHRKTIGDDKPQNMKILVRRYYEDGLDNLIDPCIRDHIDRRSLRTIREIAYKCISLNLKDRPSMDRIIKRIREALDIHNHEAASTITIRRHQSQNLDNYLIPLEEIKLATRNFSKKSQFQVSRSGHFFKGQLSKCWNNRRATFKRYYKDETRAEWFHNEIQMISSFNHENIIGFIGYCDEGDEKVIVYQYASKGSLDRLLQDENTRQYITWVERLRICIGSVRGLMYLQSGRGEDKILIHNNFKSTNIWLNNKLEPLIGGLYLSMVVDKNQGHVYVDSTAGIESYMDPNYLESGIIKAEADVYAMGVVMFEMLTGTAVHQERSIGDGEPQALINLVRRYYVQGLDILIDPFMKDQIYIQSLHIFKEIAYKCISLNLKDRPSLNRIRKGLEEALHIQNSTDASTITLQSQSSSLHKKLEDFRVPLKKINAATGDFSKENWIGEGGFGNVYKGLPSKSWQNCTAAIKRLNRKGGQGKEEFRNELELIFKFCHQNIINFLGYCDEENEMIIINEYASNGSLDGYLEDTHKRLNLTWVQRLRICLGTAKGLDYLHWDQIDRRSFHTFKYIAYECISLNSKDRPTIDTIIDRLEEALDFQVSKESQAKVIES